MLMIKGIVISSADVNENDRRISIVTKEKGVIQIFARGVRKNTSTSAAASQLFAYSDFSLNERNGSFFLESCKPINIFYGIRSSLEKVSLAAYFAELVKYAVMSMQPSDEILRLLLNSLYFLSEDKFDLMQLKSVFELRFACILGFTPKLVGCDECYLYSDDYMYFFYENGKILCENHYRKKFLGSGEEIPPLTVKISSAVLHIMRKVCLTDLKEVFSFRVKGKTLGKISEISETYLLMQIGHHFDTLEFYNSIKENHHE